MDRRFEEWLNNLELIALGLISYAFWHASPWRDQWMWLLWLLVPILAVRWIRYHRLWTRTPLDGWLLAFLALAVINMFAAPYTRGLIMFSRLLLGMAIYVVLVEHARVRGTLDSLLTITIILGALVGVLSLTATQWNSKSAALYFVTDRLPVLRNFPGAEGGFNANEMAGALTWLVPLIASLAFLRWRSRQPYLAAAAVFGCLIGGLFLGQSRLALVGTAAAFSIAALLLIRNMRWRVIALVGVLGLAALEILFFSQVLVPPPTEQAPVTRDEQSLIGRQDIWDSAIHIMRDYPLTGVGMSMFRDQRVRNVYPAPGYLAAILPHAHNEWLQVGTDMGLPGLAVYVGWHITAIYMLIYCWRHGTSDDRVLAVGIGGGLLAHAVFGIGDAITLWDRFIFIYWWLLGLVGAQYIIVKYRY